MSARLILVELLGLLLAICGFHLAFLQHVARAPLDRLRVGQGLLPLARKPADDPDDPVHYALMIFGTMIMAFGIILLGFTTMFEISSSR